MSSAVDSKTAAAYLIDPMNAPQPSDDTGPGSHFGSTFAPAASSSNASASAPRTSIGSNNPFRDSTEKRRSPKQSPPLEKGGASSHARHVSSGSRGSRGSPPGGFPAYRAEAFGEYADTRPRRSGSGGRPPPSYEEANSGSNSPTQKGHRRRTSSLSARYPGDDSHKPLEMLRKDSKKARRSPHTRKGHIPGPDTVDRLDPAIGGQAYHHEGPYDAALLSRNITYKHSPVAALETSNQEALKATPQENVKDSLDRHKPLDGVAAVPPGMPDRFGRVYNYEEGADLMHEENEDGPGYKRWAGKDYSPDDLKGKGDTFELDRALKAHKISDDGGIEMQDGRTLRKSIDRQQREGLIDSRDPVDIAGGQDKYVDMEFAHTRDTDAGVKRSGSLRDGLKRRIGSLRRKHHDD